MKLWIFLFLFFSNFAFANSIFVKYEDKKIQQKYQPYVNEALNYLNSNFKEFITEPINIKIDISKNNQQDSFVKYINNSCSVNINFSEEKPHIFNKFTDDFEFVLLHEIGHCLLNKNIFLSESFFWDISLSDSEISYLKSLSNKVEKPITDCLGCESKKDFNVLIAYHENFADIFSINYMNNKNKNYPIILYNYRYSNFLKSPLNTNYISHLALEKFINLKNNKEIKIIEMKIIAQESMLNYVNIFLKNRQ